jgi:hypothetical protein
MHTAFIVAAVLAAVGAVRLGAADRRPAHRGEGGAAADSSALAQAA